MLFCSSHLHPEYPRKIMSNPKALNTETVWSQNPKSEKKCHEKQTRKFVMSSLENFDQDFELTYF